MKLLTEETGAEARGAGKGAGSGHKDDDDFSSFVHTPWCVRVCTFVCISGEKMCLFALTPGKMSEIFNHLLSLSSHIL